MSKAFTDRFAEVAGSYAGFRPTYPPALYAWLAEIVPDHQLAWDCACGSGQASRNLAAHFQHVVATDASAAQLEAAATHPRIEFRVAPAEHSGLPDVSADLVTVAQALHWFDLDLFYAEVRRVVKPGGVLAAWTYGVMAVDGDEVNAAVQTFYYDVIGPYWPPERRHVESGYRTLPFPFDEITPPVFRMQVAWTLPELLGYLRTWSGTIGFVSVRGFDPVEALGRQLASRWSDPVAHPSTRRTVTWPLSLRVARI